MTTEWDLKIKLDVDGFIGPGKTLEVTAQATIDVPLVRSGGTMRFGTVVNPHALILDSGTLKVTAGDLVVAAGTSLDATSGMTVNVTHGKLNVAAGGEFNAINATFDFSGGINNSGDVNLINSTVNGSLENGTVGSVALLGSITFSDDLALSSSSTLFFDFAGDQPGEFDSLSIGGDAALAGNLVVALTSGFAPTVGDMFEIVDIDGTQSGTFAGLDDDSLVGNFGGADFSSTTTAATATTWCCSPRPELMSNWTTTAMLTVPTFWRFSAVIPR
ncbi:hypothetical protein OAS39_02900 [Pirellulales bacterium]|nr:hypothetical protein [Pirellulales bacterium]